ncbi:MAG TPA: NADH:flavin oxidoreductase [Candidatus Ozemobacteraceae bacterium]|nr:NADH:flavin oxidoreductase [Candidatus Ozemobacteraceae bacterium]
MATMQNSILFQPLTLRGHQLKNRLFSAPMASRYPTSKGEVTDALVSYYAHLALTGIGMTVVEGALVSTEGPGWPHELGIYHPIFQDGLARLAETIRERGSVPVIQLHHAGRRGLGGRTEALIGPSALPCPAFNRPVRPMTIEEIRLMIVKFTDAALLAAKAGFAGVEIHGAHGYLLHQFLTPLVNDRTDEYGVKSGNGSRFPLDVVRSIRLALPKHIVGYRLSARDYLPNGLTLNETGPFAEALTQAGVDYISVSGGMYASLYGPDSIWGRKAPFAVFRSDARAIKDRAAVPIGVAGKIQQTSMAVSILENRDADLIGLGRVILRDPSWIARARGEISTPISACLLCERCQYHTRGCPDTGHKPPWLL